MADGDVLVIRRLPATRLETLCGQFGLDDVYYAVLTCGPPTTLALWRRTGKESIFEVTARDGSEALDALRLLMADRHTFSAASYTISVGAKGMAVIDFDAVERAPPGVSEGGVHVTIIHFKWRRVPVVYAMADARSAERINRLLLAYRFRQFFEENGGAL